LHGFTAQPQATHVHIRKHHNEPRRAATTRVRRDVGVWKLVEDQLDRAVGDERVVVQHNRVVVALDKAAALFVHAEHGLDRLLQTLHWGRGLGGVLYWRGNMSPF